jgi:sulfate permease, SulP family
VLVVRCESALLYFNVEYARDRIQELLAARQDPIHLVILFLGSVPSVDLAGAELIAELQRALAARGTSLRLAEAHGQVRDALGRIGFDRSHGALDSAQSVDVILSDWEHAIV